MSGERERTQTLSKSSDGSHDDQASRLRALMRESVPEPDGQEPPPETPSTPVRERVRAEQNPRTRPRIVTIASGKGGVGKTSLSVGLAAAMAQRGGRIALLDGDLGLANADVLCGVNASVHIGHALDHGRSLADIAVRAPGGFSLIPGGSGVARLASLTDEQRERLIMGIADLEGAADLTLIDCGAGVGRGVLEFVHAADLALVVTTPEPTSIADAYALIKLLVTREGANAQRRFALIVNNARDEREARSVHQRIEGVTRRFLDARVPFAGWVPTDKAVTQAVRERSPFVIGHPRSPASRGVGRLAGYVGDRFGLRSAHDQRERRGLVRALRRVTGMGATNSPGLTESRSSASRDPVR
ncbi:MAG: MinD/ParA family protein [Planctomycetota bacterium]